MELPGTTLVGFETPVEGRRAVRVRRGFLVVLLLVVLLGLVGLLGVRSSTSSADAAGWTLSVEAPRVARAGLDVPFSVTVGHTGGFGQDVTLLVTGSYFDIFETQGFHPEPSDETRSGDGLLLTFTAPPGDRLVVTYDAYIQPSAQSGADARVAVLDGGRPVVAVPVRTIVLP